MIQKIIQITVLLFICNNHIYTQGNGQLLAVKYGKFATGISQQKIVYNDSIHLLITSWYPSKKNHKSIPITIKDCFELDGFNKAGAIDSFANEVICGEEYQINRDSLHHFLNKPTVTQLNAKPLNGKFPTFIWSYRHGTVYYQFAMSEYYASHGFIVYAVSRTKPVHTMPWEVDSSEREKLLYQYLGDMDIMFEQAKQNRNADTSKIALLSWSYGGDGAILFQQRHQQIDAVLGFSSIDFSNSFFLGNKLNQKIESNRLNKPYYLFYETVSRRGLEFTSDIIHPILKNISSLTSFNRLWHGNFNFIEGHTAGALQLPVVHPWAKQGKDAVTGYETICEWSLLYIKYLFNNKSKDWLKKQTVKIKKKLPSNFIK